jgi:hypothetical protein
VHRAAVALGRASTGALLRFRVGTEGQVRARHLALFRSAREARRVACFGVPPVHSRSDGDVKRRPGALPRGGPPFTCAVRVADRCGSRLALARPRSRTPLSPTECRLWRPDLKMGSAFPTRAFEPTQRVCAGARIAAGNPDDRYAAFPARSSSTG